MLDLEMPHVSAIEENSFDMLTQLLSLKLMGVRRLPKFLFLNLKKLKELFITKCKKLKLYKNHFEGLGNLESFRYGGQFGEEIDNLINLKKLSLNYFVFDDFFTFKGFEKLESLQITNFYLLSYTHKDLFKNLKNLKYFRFHKNSKTVQRFPRAPSECPKQTTEVLILIQEIFKSISSKIETFDCKSDVFEALNSCSTPFIYGLKSLEIQFVNEVDFMDYFLFKDNMFPNLKKLTISSKNNCVDEIPINPLRKIKKLKTLSLKYSYLEGINKKFNYLREAYFHIFLPDNISNFTNLKVLTLEGFHEKITLNESFLEELINLEDLKLHLIIESIDSNARYLFKTLIKLKNLSISYHEEIKTLKSTYFEFLINLEKLILNMNEIEIVEYGTFKNLNKLNHLDLSYNLIENLDQTMFDGLSNLKILKLNHAINGKFACTNLKKNALSAMNKLEKVSFNLNYNEFDWRD